MEHVAFIFLVTIGAVVLFQLPTGQAWPESCGTSKSHNFYFGRRGQYDKLLYVTQEVKPRSFLRKLSYDVQVPPKGHPQKGPITYIEVLDKYTDGNGGCAYLNGGGVGYRNVTLHMKSQRNQGINFVINVYGLY